MEFSYIRNKIRCYKKRGFAPKTLLKAKYRKRFGYFSLELLADQSF